MDSIKAKVIRAPQRTGYKTVTAADVPGGANQAYGPETSDKMKIIVPKGAIITATPIMVNAVATGPNTCVVNSGFVANSFDENDASLSSGAQVEDAYFDGSQSVMGSNKGIHYGNGNAQWGIRAGKHVSYVVTENGEREYSVALFITPGNTTTIAGLSLNWWVEYMFEPNIVWDQDSLV